MYDFEAVGAVRDFVEQGGNVLLILAFVTAVMWMLIYERFWYFVAMHKGTAEKVRWTWESRTDHHSWGARKIRVMLVSQTRMALERRLWLIETLVTLCPMLGLLGTVTGMIEVFDVMALSGSGNARGMAGGVSKATLPTMAGMVASLSGMLFSIQLRRYAFDEGDRLEDSLETDHEES